MIRVLALLLLSTLPAKAAEIYVCAFDQIAANKGWLPESLVISRDDAETLVFDPLIQQFNRRPIAAQSSVGRSQYAFAWAYKVRVRQGNARIPVTFRLTVRKPAGRAQFEVSSPELGGVFRTAGRCKITPRALQ